MKTRVITKMRSRKERAPASLRQAGFGDCMPFIRLRGKWITEKAGIVPGDTLQVVAENGKITIIKREIIKFSHGQPEACIDCHPGIGGCDGCYIREIFK